MSNFTIPKGLDFSFRIKVIEQDSFLPQNLTHKATATFSIIEKSTQTLVVFGQDSADNDINSIPLTVPTGDNIVITEAVDAVDEVNAVDTIKVASAGKLLYSMTIEGLTYQADFRADETVPTAAEIITRLFDSVTTQPVEANIVKNSTILTVTTESKPSTIEVTGNLLLESTTTGVELVEAVDEEVLNVEEQNAINGLLEGTIPAAYTAKLTDTPYGTAVDNYYLRPLYSGVITITFTEGSGIPPITTIVKDIYVTPTGL